jgi:hypothetical protein
MAGRVRQCGWVGAAARAKLMPQGQVHPCGAHKQHPRGGVRLWAGAQLRNGCASVGPPRGNIDGGGPGSRVPLKISFPGTLRVANDAIPECFGCPTKPGDAEHSPVEEEVSDSADLEGVAIPLVSEPAVAPSDTNLSLSSSQLSSTACLTPSPQRTPLHPVAAPALPHMPPQAPAPGPLSTPRPATRITPWSAPPKRPLPAPSV